MNDPRGILEEFAAAARLGCGGEYLDGFRVFDPDRKCVARMTPEQIERERERNRRRDRREYQREWAAAKRKVRAA